jgi:hypothetical protein
MTEPRGVRPHASDDLRRWIQAAIGAPVARVTEDDLAAARRLREAIRRCADARVEGRPPPRRLVGEVRAFRDRRQQQAELEAVAVVPR